MTKANGRKMAMDNPTELLELAQAGDAAAQFDLLTRRHGYAADGAPEPDPNGRRELRLRPSAERRILPDVYRRMDLVDKDLLAVFRRLVSGQTKWPLLLHGGVGTGKTCAALCLADFADSAAYYAVADLCDMTMQQSPEEVAATWNKIAGKELVILDEIGTRTQVGDLEYGVVKRVLDAREFHAGHVAVYISNLPPKLLTALYDQRIVSRLTAGTVHRLPKGDRRLTG